MRQTIDVIRQWIAHQWTVLKPWMLRQWQRFMPWFLHQWSLFKAWANRMWHLWTDRDNRWLSLPCTVAALLVLLVSVKSCQGIVYYYTPECKILKLGYPIDEARTLATALNHEQVDSLIARGEHDTIAYPIINERYYIADNFDRYLAFHKSDTTDAPLGDIVAAVNVGIDLDPQESAVPCDTTMDRLMLVNRFHYLNEHHKPRKLKEFKKIFCYEEQKAAPAVVKAFEAMQKDCKKQTGAQLMVNSAYRSYKQQIATYKRNDKRFVARAGFSEHQTGFAIDVTSLQHPMRWPFDTSKEGIWMREHCHEYGFILRYPKDRGHFMNYSYEPWHLRYVGEIAACQMHDEGITFDEYYAYYIEPQAKPQRR